MAYVLEIGCVDRSSVISPLVHVLGEFAELGADRVRAEFMESPDRRVRRSAEFGAATGQTERTIAAIIDELTLTDDVAIFFEKEIGHVVVSAPDYMNKNIWILDAESLVPWEETVLDAVAAMDGVGFAIHACGDTIVTGSVDISAVMELPVADYRYISGRIRPDRIMKAQER